MNPIEAQMKLGRELFEINTHVVRRMAEITGNGIKQYFETNQEYFQKLTEVKDVAGVFELQREYGETLFSDASSNLQTSGEVVKEAFERGGDALRDAFSATKEAVEDAVEDIAA